MTTYILRRCLYAIPIVIGVMVITFVLFFLINSPENMARRMMGEKGATPQRIEQWKREHGYHLPLLYNASEPGMSAVTQTIFAQKALPLLWFDFGKSDSDNRDIRREIVTRMGPSLMIAIPTFLIGLFVNITCAMFVAYYRGTYLDYWGVTLCVVMMSVSSLFYIIGGQFVFSKYLRLVPMSGFDSGLESVKFILLPILIGVMTGIGGGVRFYRTIFLEEIGKDYIRTARAKGLSEPTVLFRHGLKNAMIPILTGVVMAIPFLFMGSLVMEAFFGIPGLGGFTYDAIMENDFAVVRSMVFLGAVLYIIGLIMTDISYSMVDPRVRFE